MYDTKTVFYWTNINENVLSVTIFMKSCQSSWSQTWVKAKKLEKMLLATATSNRQRKADSPQLKTQFPRPSFLKYISFLYPNSVNLSIFSISRKCLASIYVPLLCTLLSNVQVGFCQISTCNTTHHHTPCLVQGKVDTFNAGRHLHASKNKYHLCSY